MRKLILLLVVITLFLMSCTKEGENSYSPVIREEMGHSSYDIDTLGVPESLDERFSYAYGNLLAESLERASQDVDALYFARGFLDYYSSSFFTDEELDAIFLEYQNRMLEEASIEYERKSEENLKEADEFLDVNGKRSGVITTSSGLEYEVVRAVEDAPRPKEDDTVLIDYKMTLLNGQIVESSYDRGIGAEIPVVDLIEGAREGILLMKKGERFRFWIHPSLGYGENGISSIGPNELLIFEVELFDIL